MRASHPKQNRLEWALGGSAPYCVTVRTMVWLVTC
jgi:hypothetical protein